MTNSDLTPDALHNLVREKILSPDFLRATFSGIARWNPSPWVRVTVRPVPIRDERFLQFSCFDGRKTTVQNHPVPDASAALDPILALGYAGIHLSLQTEEVDLQITKKGKIILGRRKVDTPVVQSPPAHNRVKDVPLPEGKANQLLEVMGILTRSGSVRPTMRAKYTQINEFLKHLLHVFDDADLRSLGRPLEILDCGCGASYLTLAVHHYLNEILGVPARILGVDVNEEVIRNSVERAERLQTSGLDFTCGKIGNIDIRADIVLALHACDTATDDAIAQAVRSEARLLLSVPCCHHDLNRSIRPEGPASVLRPILRHGILQQRTADLVTDAFRALALRIMGYRTDVVEFVSPEHTARNLMIRAVRGSHERESTLVAEYLQMRNFWGVTPYIERALGEPFGQRLRGNG